MFVIIVSNPNYLPGIPQFKSNRVLRKGIKHIINDTNQGNAWLHTRPIKCPALRRMDEWMEGFARTRF